MLLLLSFLKMVGNETGYAMLGVFGEISCPTVMAFARAINLTNRLTPQYCIPDVTGRFYKNLNIIKLHWDELIICPPVPDFLRGISVKRSNSLSNSTVHKPNWITNQMSKYKILTHSCYIGTSDSSVRPYQTFYEENLSNVAIHYQVSPRLYRTWSLFFAWYPKKLICFMSHWDE